MNKKTKSIIASTLAFGTLLGASASVAPVINHTAHAATTQEHQSAYYTYKGNAGYDAKFTLDKNFKNAIKAGNVTFNGIKIAPTQSTQTVIKSDQLFRQYDKKSKKASLVDIPLKKQLKLTDLQKSYGKDLKKVDNGKNNTTGIYYYQPKKNGEAVWFDASKGKIDRVVIGYEKTKVAIQKDKTLNKIK